MTAPSPKIFPDETVAHVQRTWSMINADLVAVGSNILLRLFTKHPEYQLKFMTFKTTPLNELRLNREFVRHSGVLAGALNFAVQNLNNANVLVPKLLQLGRNHRPRMVTPEHFRNAQMVVLEAVHDALQGQATDQVMKAWNDVLTVAVSTLTKGLLEG